jgi:hypothetical protein
LIINPENIRVVYFKMGDIVYASGYLDITSPERVDLSVNLTDFILEEFLGLFIGNRPEVSGRISGSIDIEGPFAEPMARIRLSAENGSLGDISYKKMLVNANGLWPYLEIIDSRIIRKDSSFDIEGILDMRRLGSRYIMEDITVSTHDNTIIWEGWDITMIDESHGLLLQRSLGSGVRMGYKTYMTDETRYRPVEERDEFQLEYDLFDDESMLTFHAKENEEFLGIKKRYRF